MIRLICFILIFAIFLVFIGLNLGNHCNVNVGFRNFEDTPVYITALASFFLGMILTIPIVLPLRKKRKDDMQATRTKQKKEKPGKKKKNPDVQQAEVPNEIGPYGID